MSYNITTTTTSDQIASFLNTEFSAIYQLAVQSGSSAATVISNICTVPSPLVNPPLYAWWRRAAMGRAAPRYRVRLTTLKASDIAGMG